MKLAAYISRGQCFIARFGNWKWLYEDIPSDAKWIFNDRGGKCVDKEDIGYACMNNENLLTSEHYSDDELMNALMHG